jgi:hypothetical protein
MSKEILDIVEDVKTGKTIIYIGKDLIMMNMAKYKEYVELEEEPVSKRILQDKCEEQEKVLNIIKEKNVLCDQIKYCDTVNDYNELVEETSFEQLLQKEFNTLKEWLEKNE